MTTYDPKVLNQVENILNIGISLSAERDHNRLLERILTEARKITRADAGTLYLREKDRLIFSIIQNESLNIFQGGSGEPIDLPPVKIEKTSVSGYTAITREIVNIPDVYQAQGFDFSGPKKYDSLTGYRTTSMLVLPLENHRQEVIGVLQLINACNELGKTIPFKPHLEKVISSLASQAAISMTKTQMMAEIENLFQSFVMVMATAIDARTPYNANHTRRVARLSLELSQCINKITTGPLAEEEFDENRTRQLVMAAWLHDIGKVAIPLSVMNKATRLEERMDIIQLRLDYIKAIDPNRGENVEEARELIIRANDPSFFVDDETLAHLQEIAELTYTDGQGREKRWLTKEELEALSVSKGTLTEEERKIMEDHVEIADRILQKIPFTSNLKDVPSWASLHHEMLNGNGYPQQLSGAEIPLEGRILALADIFDALTASDRPYKAALSVEKSLEILSFMIEDNMLDKDLYQVFLDCKVWKCTDREISEDSAFKGLFSSD